MSAASAREGPAPTGIDELVEEYLQRLTDGEEVSVERFAGRLAEPEGQAAFRLAILPLEYRWRSERGEDVPLEGFLARLASDDERERFLASIEDARRATRHLPARLVPGALLAGRYEVRRELGRGGMGVVYAAFDRELEREVAVKVFHFAGRSAGANDWEETLRRESKSLARLKSRHIVAVHDVQRGEETSFLVMDLVEGTDLQQVIRRCRAARAGGRRPDGRLLREAIGAPRDPDRAELVGRDWYRSVARVVREIAFTLELAHDEGVVHRDLKPSNVLLDGGGEPILLDFGLATTIAGDLGEGRFRGTPEYLAPEQAQEGRAGTDPRTDVYQLGLLLYELTTLERAFPRRPGEPLVALLMRVARGEHRPLGQRDARAPAALRRISAKALATDPGERYESAGALRADLDRFVAGLPPLHARVNRAEELGMRTAYAVRHPAAIALLAIALVAAAVGWARRPEWNPPRVTPFFHEAGMEGPLEIGGAESLVVHEDLSIMGVRAEVGLPTWLYVFSVYGGEESDEQFLRPERPQRFGALGALDPPGDGGPAAVRLERGVHRLSCKTIEEPSPIEGLLLFAAPERSALLDAWQAELERIMEYELRDDVRLHVAMAASEHLLKTSRGGRPLAQLTPEDHARLFGNVTDGELGADLWRELGIERFVFAVRIRDEGVAEE